MKRYDYVFMGAGAAGLSLLTRMLKSAHFDKASFLLIDRDSKDTNDRTWCFWEDGEGFFEEIVHRKWRRLWLYFEDRPAMVDISPYQYKMIRGIDLYKFCFDVINRNNVDIVQGNIITTQCSGNHLTVEFEHETLEIEAGVVFNSIPFKYPQARLGMLQHFKGWLIETQEPVFDEEVATLMDFRVHQDHGTTFVYTLPLSPTRALIEYTVFSKELLHGEQYVHELDNYIARYVNPGKFNVVAQEFGVIPMTSTRYNFFENGMYHIGTAGGQTKSSTGYTFQFVQKQSEMIIDFLKRQKPLSSIPDPGSRFNFYDRVLLQVLQSGKLKGRDIFSRLFSANKPTQVLKFLDNDTTLWEEMKIISTLPTAPFLKAAILQAV